MQFIDDVDSDDNSLISKSEKRVSSTVELAKKLGAKRVDKSLKDSSDSSYLVTSDDIDNFLSSKDSSENKNSISIDDDRVNHYNSGQFIPFKFRGEAKEYFKIWIVNIALTLLTLGIYSAWAKVRNNRYMYSNTYLNGSNFEYNASPKRVLYGRVIVFLFYALFLLFSDVLYNQTLALGVVAIFLLLLPWLIRQAISFRLKSASYRNIHFRYHGQTRSFYKLVLVIIILVTILFLPLIISKYIDVNSGFISLLSFAFTFLFFIIGIPILYLKFKELIINNSAYGNSLFRFEATKSSVVGLFIKMAFATTIVSLIIGVITIVTSSGFAKILNITDLNLKSDISVLLTTTGVSFIYLVSIGLYKGINDGYLSNFTRDHTKIVNGELKGTISPFKLGFISMTNIFVVIFSLGLMYPWAKMRYLRYKIENTHFKCKEYTQFSSDGRDRGSTVGEEAVDFFDIDIGV